MKTVFIFSLLSLISMASVQGQTLEKCKPLEKLIGKINDKKRFSYSSVNKMIILSESTKCEDVHYTAGISDIVVRALVNDFVRTVKVAGKNTNSLSFVVAHIDSSTESVDLTKITDNVLKICPREKRAVCTKIDEAVQKAKKGKARS